MVRHHAAAGAVAAVAPARQARPLVHGASAAARAAAVRASHLQLGQAVRRRPLAGPARALAAAAPAVVGAAATRGAIRAVGAAGAGRAGLRGRARLHDAQQRREGGERGGGALVGVHGQQRAEEAVQ